MTLAEFIKARLDEDEAAAQAEIEMQQRFFPQPEFVVEYQWVRHTRLPATGGAGSSYALGAPSPVRVLAEVEAKRRIVELHEHSHSCVDANGMDDYVFTDSPSRVHCATLHLLALPYAGHPDYHESWRP